MDQAPWQEIDVHEGIENTLIILGHKLRNVTVTRDFDRALPRLCAYGGELNQVWTNLIDNAIYAVGGTGRIDVRTRRDGEFLFVEIADNGSGIPPEAQPHIFSLPFFTTKGTSGAGLGLVISHRIDDERHHGKIDFSTGPDGTQSDVGFRLNPPRTLSLSSRARHRAGRMKDRCRLCYTGEPATGRNRSDRRALPGTLPLVLCEPIKPACIFLRL